MIFADYRLAIEIPLYFRLPSTQNPVSVYIRSSILGDLNATKNSHPTRPLDSR